MEKKRRSEIKMSVRKQRTNVVLLKCTVLLLLLLSPTKANGWQWSDYMSGFLFSEQISSLSLYEVSDMRVRDIKRRLARTHGYSAEEIGKMLDKKELIQALSYEEYRVQQFEGAAMVRSRIKYGIITAMIAVSVVLLWPIFSHVFEVAHVNFVVYTDRKRVECERCIELRSFESMFGVVCMLVLDLLGLWLSVSVILSWVMMSKYFFPIPSLSIHPAAMISGKVAAGPLAKYGINVGPIVITWVLRFLSRWLEGLTGRALLRAAKRVKKHARTWESAEEKATRKAAKRERKTAQEAAKQQAKEARRRRESPPASNQQPEASVPDPFEEPKPKEGGEKSTASAAASAAERRWNESHCKGFTLSAKKLSVMDELD